MRDTLSNNELESLLYNDVCSIIDDTRHRVAAYVSSESCLMNWNVGKRIKEDILYNTRAEYGKQVLKNLSEQLKEKYGSGWGFQKLQHCVRSAYTFSEEDISHAINSHLSWTHLRSLMAVSNNLARQFYMEMCRLEHWDTRTLDKKIESNLFERTAISRRPDHIIKSELAEVKNKDLIVPDLVFRSSYFLDMLGLPDIFQKVILKMP